MIFGDEDAAALAHELAHPIGWRIFELVMEMRRIPDVAELTRLLNETGDTIKARRIWQLSLIELLEGIEWLPATARGEGSFRISERGPMKMHPARALPAAKVTKGGA